MKEKKEKEENKIYLIKGSKQVVSGWEFMQQTGTLDRMKQKGITINPTHSFELLKQTRQELFEKAKQNFSEERKMKKLATSDFEISCLYYSWLKGELNTIENWLSDTYPNGKKRLKPSTSDQIEILKYKQYVNNEMTQAENEISPPQPIVKQKPEQETPKTFDELFYNTDLVKPCIDILKELDPPLIDTDCNYIGKLKGVFCVWIDEMQRQGIVKHYSDRKIFASLIPQKIKRFSIDESMFGKYQSNAENLYRTDIKTKVSNIKLSQNSQ